MNTNQLSVKEKIEILFIATSISERLGKFEVNHIIDIYKKLTSTITDVDQRRGD